MSLTDWLLTAKNYYMKRARKLPRLKNISDIFLFIMEQAAYENMKREIEKRQLYIEKKISNHHKLKSIVEFL